MQVQSPKFSPTEHDGHMMGRKLLRNLVLATSRDKL